MWLVPLYTPGWRETKLSKVPCLRKQRDRRGLNPRPPDPLEFEVLTARRPHMPPQKVGVEKDPTNFFSVEQWGCCLCSIVLTTSLTAFCGRRMWLLILGILWYLGVPRYSELTGIFTIFFIACLPFWHHFKLSYNVYVIHSRVSPFHKVQIRSDATVKRTTDGYSFWVHSSAPNLCSANYVNPLNPNVKIQILICCPHMFSIEAVGRICWSIN